MITVSILRNSKQAIVGFKVSGHANTAPHGQDIVCAGVSALTQGAVLGLTKHLAKKVQLDIASGKLAVELADGPDELTSAILETMFLGLIEISKLYPNSVRISEHRR